ncbi:MAG: glutamate--tRNA ligase family protein [Terracidiphilus sp.]
MLDTLIASMASLSSSPESSYRGRLAPSPSGYLHMGHAQTFWSAYQRANDAGGTLVMRMEDLDPERSRQTYAEAALEDLRWLGICWQEGPDLGGPFAPYAQSQRKNIYLAVWRKLLRGGFLFPCRCSRKDLETALTAPHESVSAGGQGNEMTEPLDDEPVYPGACRPGAFRHQASRGSEGDIPRPFDPTASEIEEPGSFNWRFRVPGGEAVEFEDRNLGSQRFVAGVDFGDFVVWRRDGVPSYQLACVADDAAMGITEVVRGADLLKSTARQILLYRALELETPHWFHCRLVVDRNGRRLAKRCDSLSLRTLRQRGFAPEQILSGELPVEG